MRLTDKQIRRLEDFLDRIKTETYPEPVMPHHDHITRLMLPQVVEMSQIKPGAKVLDVGCGQGVALEKFKAADLDAIGITLNDEDLRVCRERGFDVREMDQSFLDFEDAAFDLVWCRHCLEHSIFPYFTLSEFRRVLRPMGWAYIEVPVPDTNANHQTNRNHYSVLGKSMWQSLFVRTGFRNHADSEIKLTTGVGPDIYWQFLLQRFD